MSAESQYIDGMYNKLREFNVELDSDPLVYGPKRLNEKTAELQRINTLNDQVFLDVSHRLAQAKRELRAKTTQFNASRQILLSSDPMIRAEKSVSDRDAAVAVRLRDLVSETSALEEIVDDLDNLLTVVKSKKFELRDTQSRLRDQRRFCEAEISLGARWGCASPNYQDRPAQPLEDLAKSDDVLDAMIASITGETDSVEETVAVEKIDLTTVLPSSNNYDEDAILSGLSNTLTKKIGDAYDRAQDDKNFLDLDL